MPDPASEPAHEMYPPVGIVIVPAAKSIVGAVVSTLMFVERSGSIAPLESDAW
jgi:hypothetical protein